MLTKGLFRPQNRHDTFRRPFSESGNEDADTRRVLERAGGIEDGEDKGETENDSRCF